MGNILALWGETETNTRKGSVKELLAGPANSFTGGGVKKDCDRSIIYSANPAWVEEGAL